MQAIYNTQKKPGQTLEQFQVDLVANTDSWIELINKKRVAQDSAVSAIHSASQGMTIAIENGLRQISRQLEKDYPADIIQAIGSVQEDLEAKKCAVTRMLIPDTLKVPYQDYLVVLDGIKRDKMLKSAGVSRPPLFVPFPSVLIDINTPRRGTYSDDDSVLEQGVIMSLQNYANLMKTYYPSYIRGLDEEEKTSVVSTQKFGELVDATMVKLQEFDILDIENNHGDRCLFVFIHNGELHVVRYIGDCLPREAYPMLKRFGVQTRDDLQLLYNTYDLIGVEMCKEFLTFAARGEKHIRVKLDGHIVFADEDCVEWLPQEVLCA